MRGDGASRGGCETSRVTRLLHARHEAQPKDDETPITLDPALKMFTELPPEFTFAQLKSSRQELETTVSRHKEQEEMME